MKQENTTYIDLHNHTKYSDGMFLSPKDLIRLSFLNGTNVLAITDHDNCYGYFEGAPEAKKLGMTLLPGAEITTPNYHLLALNFNPNDSGFSKFLKHSREIQEEKCRLRVEKLSEHGLPFEMNDVYSMFDPAKIRIGKYNIFIAMMFKPTCREAVYSETPQLNFYERFRYYLGSDGVVGKLPDVGVSPAEAIAAVHSAKGLIGIAHPFKDIYDVSEMERLVSLGIDFLEIQPNYRGKENKVYTNEFFEKYAKENSLPVSYGSDYHGPSFYRKLLERGENVLHPNLERLLNQGHVKIPKMQLVKKWQQHLKI